MKYEQNRNMVKLALAVFAVLIMVLIVLLVNTSTKPVEVQDIGQIDYFKDFSLKLFGKDEQYTNANLKDQKITVVNGWAPWCSGCVSEMPDLEELNKEYTGRGLQIIGVVVDYSSTAKDSPDYESKIQEKISNTGVTYPILLADEKFEQVVAPTAHSAFPCTWILNGDGEIIDYVNGARSADKWKMLFEQWLSKTEEG